jgi:hypothetical protein
MKPFLFFFLFLYRSKIFTYDQVVEKVAEKLGVDDPSKIRLTSHNCYSQQPKPQPIKYRGVERLLDMLIHYNQVATLSFDLCFRLSVGLHASKVQDNIFFSSTRLLIFCTMKYWTYHFQNYKR